MKNCVGFDIGSLAVHVAVVKNGKVTAGINAAHGGLAEGGAVKSFADMAEFLKTLRRTEKLPARNAALVLPAGQYYCRRFEIAAATREQMTFNLPYGFRDYITDGKENYFFDCVLLGSGQREDGTPYMEVFAAAARKETIKNYVGMFGEAGFKLKTVIPPEFAYANLLKRAATVHRHGIMDIGQNSVRLYLYNGDASVSVRTAGYGGPGESYASAALEILKAVNFYRFSSGEALEHLHCCGGGVHNAEFMDTLRKALPLPLDDLSEFPEVSAQTDAASVAAAAGAALQ